MFVCLSVTHNLFQRNWCVDSSEVGLIDTAPYEFLINSRTISRKVRVAAEEAISKMKCELTYIQQIRHFFPSNWILFDYRNQLRLQPHTYENIANWSTSIKSCSKAGTFYSQIHFPFHHEFIVGI